MESTREGLARCVQKPGLGTPGSAGLARGDSGYMVACGQTAAQSGLECQVSRRGQKGQI